MSSCLILTPSPWRVFLAFPLLWWLLWLQHCQWNSRFYRVSISPPPTVPPHPGCFIHKTWTSPPLSDCCLLSFRRLLPLFYVSSRRSTEECTHNLYFLIWKVNQLLLFLFELSGTLFKAQNAVSSPATTSGRFLISSVEDSLHTRDLPCWESPQQNHLPWLCTTATLALLDKRGVAAASLGSTKPAWMEWHSLESNITRIGVFIELSNWAHCFNWISFASKLAWVQIACKIAFISVTIKPHRVTSWVWDLSNKKANKKRENQTSGRWCFSDDQWGVGHASVPATPVKECQR